jgi:hypothetical protein
MIPRHSHTHSPTGRYTHTQSDIHPTRHHHHLAQPRSSLPRLYPFIFVHTSSRSLWTIASSFKATCCRRQNNIHPPERRSTLVSAVSLNSQQTDKQLCRRQYRLLGGVSNVPGGIDAVYRGSASVVAVIVLRFHSGAAARPLHSSSTCRSIRITRRSLAISSAGYPVRLWSVPRSQGEHQEGIRRSLHPWEIGKLGE